MMDQNKATDVLWNEFLQSGNPGVYLRYTGMKHAGETGALFNCNKTPLLL
jgi:hypothetical protein